jgi:hypothetical protein
VAEKYSLSGLKALQVILAERVAKGWGIPKIELFNKEKLESTIAIQDLFECVLFKGKGEREGDSTR